MSNKSVFPALTLQKRAIYIPATLWKDDTFLLLDDVVCFVSLGRKIENQGIIKPLRYCDCFISRGI